MFDPIPPSIALVPNAADLRHRLAVALREVDLLRRLIRIANHTAHYGTSGHPQTSTAGRHEVTSAAR
jgi:hypothetical protein